MHTDRLSSTSVASDASGALVSRQTYFAFGAPRTSEGTLPTDYTFTGQKFDASAGLMYYGARYYDAAIGRFVQADTIVPNAGNPQALNRYAYTLNNPVRYTDPTGYHEDCDSGPCPELDHTLRSVIHELGFTPEGIGAWGNDELKELRDWLKAGVRFTSEAVVTSAGELLLSKPWSGPNLADALAALRAVKDKLGANTMEALGLVNGGTLTLNSLLAGRADPGAVGGFTTQPQNRIDLFLINGSNAKTIETIIHEIGHLVDWRARDSGSQWSWSVTSPLWLQAGGWKACYVCGTMTSSIYGPTDYSLTNPGEDFADTFMAWVTGATYPRPVTDERLSALAVALGRIH